MNFLDIKNGELLTDYNILRTEKLNLRMGKSIYFAFLLSVRKRKQKYS